LLGSDPETSQRVMPDVPDRVISGVGKPQPEEAALLAVIEGNKYQRIVKYQSTVFDTEVRPRLKRSRTFEGQP
jgi:hypothetical protein